MFTKYPVILASASPRRQQLLQPLVESFRVVPADLDEDALTESDPWATATNLAIAKARSIAREYPGHLVIGGDTVVAYEDSDGWHQLSKPTDSDDAIRILTLLSDRQHVVITGLALVYPAGEQLTSDHTEVTFRALSHEEIVAYVATGEPMDKAGAYAIQGGASGFVSATKGNISAVVGLPVERLEEILSRITAGA